MLECKRIMVRTRIAPSPTGQDFHIGNAYTALINYIYAKQQKGTFIVRIEDTDRARFVEGSEERILNTIEWLGLTPDESPKHEGKFGPYRQSERKKLYKQYAQELIEKNKAYYCFCSPQRLSEVRSKLQKEGKPPMYDGHCLQLANNEVQKRLGNNEQHVIRLKVPESGQTCFDDLVRGKVCFQNNLIDDQVLLKSDGFPTYHLAVVVDDHMMEITHVIRAEEWVSSTPKHILLYTAFGWSLPKYAHVPILRNTDKSKLSKRKNPVWVSDYKKEGFLPDVIVNYLLTLGWTHPKEKTIFPLSEAIKFFSFERVNKTGPVFDIVKLTWMNGEYIRAISDRELADKMYAFCNSKYDRSLLLLVSPLIKERIKKLSDIKPLIDFFVKTPVVDIKTLVPKKRDESETRAVIKTTIERFNQVKKWKSKDIHEAGNMLIEETGWKPIELFQTIRVAISGKTVTPPLFESMEILKKEECIKRLESSLGLLS